MKFSISVAALSAVFAGPLMAGESVTYEHEGMELEGYKAEASSPKGTVLIIHDWDGLTDYEKKRADMLAEAGYNAFAVDLYGKGNLPQSVEENKAKTGELYNDREKMRALILAGAEQAGGMGGNGMVVMGYCFGGAATLELARSGKGQEHNVTGYATFHGGLSTPEGQSYASDTAPILVAHGGADSSITMDDVADLGKRLEEAGVTYEIEVYSGAPHGFTVFDSDRYQERADKKSWDAFMEFIDSQFQGA
jgi:dienelactone hydrolase